MYLHEAIDQVLREARQPMSSREVADAINARGLYQRSDGQPLGASQIAARVRRPEYRDRYRIDPDHNIGPA